MSESDLAGLMNIPWVESPFFDILLGSKSPDEERRELARRFHEDGYLVLDDLVSPVECDRIIAEAAGLFDPDTPEGPRSCYRVQDAWKESPTVARVAGDRRVLELLRFLYEREPIPFQTLNFLRGTQQPVHSDLTHFSCWPERYMAGVWVALEDMTADNGPLHYYPGSHRLPVFDLADFNSSLGDEKLGERYLAFQDLLRERYEYREFRARKGQALIWAANLWHGGCPVKEKASTRHSLVTHYYFEGGFYYYPLNSVPALGEYDLKEIVNVLTGEKVPHTFNGTIVEAEPVGDGRSLVRVPGRGRPSTPQGEPDHHGS